jgi:hypothetical protein
MFIGAVFMVAATTLEACAEIATVFWMACIDSQIDQITLQRITCYQVPAEQRCVLPVPAQPGKESTSS